MHELGWKDLNFTHCPGLLPPVRQLCVSPRDSCFLDHLPLSQLLTLATCALSPACPLFSPGPEFSCFCKTSTYLVGPIEFSHPSFIYLFLSTGILSMCTVVWIVMNFGLNSRLSKACFQLNKPKTWNASAPFYFILITHPSREDG